MVSVTHVVVFVVFAAFIVYVAFVAFAIFIVVVVVVIVLVVVLVVVACSGPTWHGCLHHVSARMDARTMRVDKTQRNQCQEVTEPLAGTTNTTKSMPGSHETIGRHHEHNEIRRPGTTTIARTILQW